MAHYMLWQGCWVGGWGVELAVQVDWGSQTPHYSSVRTYRADRRHVAAGCAVPSLSRGNNELKAVESLKKKPSWQLDNDGEIGKTWEYGGEGGGMMIRKQKAITPVSINMQHTIWRDADGGVQPNHCCTKITKVVVFVCVCVLFLMAVQLRMHKCF